MPDAIPDPIPQNLRDAFCSAVAAYRNWSPGEPEPKVSLDMRPVLISTVLEIVMNFSDPMPDDLQHVLANLVQHGDGSLGDRSYGAGARYLLALMRECIDRHEYVQKHTQR
jgi:hypothetical protein